MSRRLVAALVDVARVRFAVSKRRLGAGRGPMSRGLAPAPFDAARVRFAVPERPLAAHGGRA